MRLFYALLFDDETKSRLALLRDAAADMAVKGRFTRTENFHLTLAFIGEAAGSKAAALEEVLDELARSRIRVPGKLVGSYLGTFQKGNRQILWLGLEKNRELKQLQAKLARLLEEAGIEFEKRRYQPHVTLGRQVLMEKDLEEIIMQPLDIGISGAALMESRQEDGRLEYVPLAILD